MDNHCKNLRDYVVRGLILSVLLSLMRITATTMPPIYCCGDSVMRELSITTSNTRNGLPSEISRTTTKTETVLSKSGSSKLAKFS